METRIYPDIDHIPQELQLAVGELLYREIPCLAWLQKKDQLHHRKTLYHLFFPQGSSIPSGLLRLTTRTFTDTRKRSSLLQKLLISPATPETWIGIQSPGVSGHGVIFSPQSDEAQSIQMILTTLNVMMKEHRGLIQLTLPPSLSLPLTYRAQETEHCEFKILSKSLCPLPQELKNKIAGEKKLMDANKDYKLVNGASWGELLQHCSPSTQSSLEQKMESYLNLNCYKDLCVQYIVLLHNERPLTIAPFTKGEKGQAFAEVLLNLDGEINSPFTLLILQELINIFDNDPLLQDLSLINTFNFPQDLKKNLPLFNFTPSRGKTYLIPLQEKKMTTKKLWTGISP